MSDNDAGQKKLPGKSMQIILFVVFAVIAIALVMIVQPQSKVQINSSSPGGAPAAAPQGAPPGAPPAK